MSVAVLNLMKLILAAVSLYNSFNTSVEIKGHINWFLEIIMNYTICLKHHLNSDVPIATYIVYIIISRYLSEV